MTPLRQLTLSARTLAELNDYLKKTYAPTGDEETEEEGFIECFLCMSFVSEVSISLRSSFHSRGLRMIRDGGELIDGCLIRGINVREGNATYECIVIARERRCYDVPTVQQRIVPSQSLLPPYRRITESNLLLSSPNSPSDHDNRPWMPSAGAGGLIGIPVGPEAMNFARNGGQDHSDDEDQLDDGATQATQPQKQKKKRVSAAGSGKRKSNARVVEEEEEEEDQPMD